MKLFKILAILSIICVSSIAANSLNRVKKAAKAKKTMTKDDNGSGSWETGYVLKSLSIGQLFTCNLPSFNAKTFTENASATALKYDKADKCPLDKQKACSYLVPGASAAEFSIPLRKLSSSMINGGGTWSYKYIKGPSADGNQICTWQMPYKSVTGTYITGDQIKSIRGHMNTRIIEVTNAITDQFKKVIKNSIRIKSYNDVITVENKTLDEIKAKIAAKKAAIQAKNKEIEAKQKENKLNQDSLSASEKKVNKLNSAVTTYDETINTTDEQIKKLSSDKDTLQADIADYEKMQKSREATLATELTTLNKMLAPYILSEEAIFTTAQSKITGPIAEDTLDAAAPLDGFF